MIISALMSKVTYYTEIKDESTNAKERIKKLDALMERVNKLDPLDVGEVRFILSRFQVLYDILFMNNFLLSIGDLDNGG